MKVSRQELEKEIRSPFALKLPQYFNNAYVECLINRLTEIDVPDSFYKDAAMAEMEYNEEQVLIRKREKEHQIISDYRLSGMEAEKNGDIYAAIDNYAKSILNGEQSEFNLLMAFAHSYERIIVCFHKLKDFEHEADYIKKYLNHNLPESTKIKFNERLNKLQSKL